MLRIPFFSSATPFGPLQPLHEYVIKNAVPIDWSNWYRLFIIALIPLYAQALLLRCEGTRILRSALAVVGIALLWHAGTTIRFAQPWLNALNNGIGIGLFHLTVRYLEFGLIKGPVYDRYFEAKGRHPLVSAFDVCINARWIGLGVLDLDNSGAVQRSGDKGSANGGPNGNVPVESDVPDGGFKAQGRTMPNMRTKESWLPWPKIQRTRAQAVRRHATIAFKNYVLFDTFLCLIREFGADTVGSPTPVPNALYRFSHENKFVLLPFIENNGTRGLFTAPWWLVEFVTEVGVASGVWLGISAGFHFLGTLLVGAGLWETESWEVDLFDSPLRADSLLDFWGRRWHQFFRHHFMLCSTVLLRLFGLPVTSPAILGLSFFFSGAMHALGQFAMSPNPNLFPIFILFPLCGAGCAAEVIFKRITGRKVRGFWGRLWVWTAMLATGRLGTIAWLESGVGGSYLSPPWAGVYVTDWMKKWVVDKIAA
ncbi:hypothetical protein IAU60_000940 [Kwoniella sp. DSM 27419]